MNDQLYMREALALARTAAEQGEIPVGAVVVKDGDIIGRGYNLRESEGRATAHAEVLAIEDACRHLGSWRLSGCTLYVTMEPCPMCAGALINSRIDKVVFGCYDAVAGCLGSVIDLCRYPFNHAFVTVGGVCEAEAADLVRDFFEARRKK